MDYMIIKGLYETGKEHELESPVLDNAIAALKGAAIKFSTDAINDANVRVSYTSNIKRVTAEVKGMVKARKITVKEASVFCYEMRNQILEEHRKYTSSTGLSFAERHKKTPPKLDDLYDKYAIKKFGRSFKELTTQQKNSIYYEIIESSARDNPKFTASNKRLKVIGKVGILITASLATYEILNAENKPKEAIKQGVQIGGGVAGGWLAGLAVAPICGPGAPVCALALILLGSTAGGIVGSMVADSLDEEIEEFTTWKIN
ncbi:MAG TPA: hypothetical protein VGL07_09335 [Buttiauxella sp.]|jgi:23S rRNA maturation mini-RNase III